MALKNKEKYNLKDKDYVVCYHSDCGWTLKMFEKSKIGRGKLLETFEGLCVENLLEEFTLWLEEEII